MKFIKLHKADAFEPWGTQKGESFIMNSAFIKKVYTTNEWRNGKPMGTVTHVVDNRGNDTCVCETQHEIESMLFGEEHDE